VTRDPHQRCECVRPVLSSKFFQIACQSVGNTDRVAPAPGTLAD
jgi:hypothetical protein